MFIEIDPDSPQLEQALQGRYPILMDPDNTIVKLCVQGMECESSGRLAEALGLFVSAWMQSKDDFERCIAAHYVARHQKEPVDALLWNQRSLDHANAIPDDRVREFYPSLYLNMGKAHEDLGNREDAKRFYQTAEKTLDSLPKGRYGTIVREAVERALLRTGN
jgi:tetratricopeptide (TPR) repeat protein